MEMDSLFTSYFTGWIDLYKRGAVRPVTLSKYETSLKRLTQIAPMLTMAALDKRAYQGILNSYAQTHERQTTLNFHHHLRAALLDAVDEGILEHDPTRRAVVKGTVSRHHSAKFLSIAQLKQLFSVLDLSGRPIWDHFIYVVAKTGLRFAEALGLTPDDFVSDCGAVKVSKTWDYKSPVPGFAPLKNKASTRTLTLDQSTRKLVRRMVADVPHEQPIFVYPGYRVFNEIANKQLHRLCVQAGVPPISMHGLRHTHASILLYAGVSVASVARRLGHANMTTTQRVYLHIIEELEAQDNEKVIRCLQDLG